MDMIVFYLWVLKPIWYALALTLVSWRLRQYRPHWRIPEWLLIVLATVARYGAAWAMFGIANWLYLNAGLHLPNVGDEKLMRIGVVVLNGLVLWLVVMRVAFRRAPTAQILLWALAAEVLSGTIDYLAFRQLENIRIC
jgi:hypothetical protein